METNHLTAKSMKKEEAAIESLARSYAARYVGVTKQYVNMAIRGERNGPVAETAKDAYRRKLNELKEVTAIPSNPNV